MIIVSSGFNLCAFVPFFITVTNKPAGEYDKAHDHFPVKRKPVTIYPHIQNDVPAYGAEFKVTQKVVHDIAGGIKPQGGRLVVARPRRCKILQGLLYAGHY